MTVGKDKSSPIKLDDGMEEWEYSPEGIQYRFAGIYGFSSMEQETLFFAALSKLPKNIIDFSEKIFFTSGSLETKGAQAFVPGDQYIGVVYFDPKFWESELTEIVDSVAHEIAHIYLGHTVEGKLKKGREIETAADKLASKWLKRKVTAGQRVKIPKV